MDVEQVGQNVVDAAICVHRSLGPGLLESAYQVCLAYELTERGLMVAYEVLLPLHYAGQKLDAGYRVDMLIERLVEQQVIIENKAVESLLPRHEAQLLTYLKLSGCWLGYLLNWNVALMKEGIHRFV